MNTYISRVHSGTGQKAICIGRRLHRQLYAYVWWDLVLSTNLTLKEDASCDNISLLLRRNIDRKMISEITC